MNGFYAIFVVLWTTYFVESWKRKENKIADSWLMRDFQDPTTEREEFKAAMFIDQETKSTDKVSRFNTYFRQVFLGIPVSVFFICMVVATQVLMKSWNDANIDEYGKDVPYHLRFTPSIVNVALIFIYGAIYKVVAQKLVDGENHRYESAYEDSLINKMYMFQFINSYISNYIIAYWVRDFGILAQNLVVIMVFKQVGANIAEYLQDKILIGRKIKKVKTHYQGQLMALSATDDTIGTEELKMQQHIEEQLVMAQQAESLIYFYNEAIIQLGFIVFFAMVFPLAPLFSFLTNLLEIKIKLNRMSRFSRRFIAQGASGIGSWTGVMELISMVSIPINVAILLFTAKGKDEDGVIDESATVKYLLEREEGRTKFEVVLILVMVEHLLLGAKIVAAQLIPDVPAQVIVDERKRPKIQDMAEDEMHSLKTGQNLKTITEIMDDIAQEKLTQAKQEAEKEILEAADREGSQLDPESRAAKKRRKIKLTQNIQEIQEKAMAQQKRINKQQKAQKNALRRKEREQFKGIKDRAVINLAGAKGAAAGAAYQ